MSNKHEKSVMRSEEARDRPFDPEVVEQAQSLAAQYHISVARNENGFLGTVSEMPTVFGCGLSEDAALRTTRDHLKWALAYLIETGRTPSPRS